MKRLKKLLPALALTLMIAGSVVASNATSNKQKTIDEWYGLPGGTEGTRTPMLPGKPDDDTDCDKVTPTDCYVHVTDEGEIFYDGGLYIGQ